MTMRHILLDIKRTTKTTVVILKKRLIKSVFNIYTYFNKISFDIDFELKNIFGKIYQ